MARVALVVLLGLLAVASRALLCSLEVGSGCGVWTASPSDDLSTCVRHTVATPHQLIEARVLDNAGSTGYELVSRSSAGVRLVGNATIAPPAVRPCRGCASTHAFFYEAAAAGTINVVGRRPFGDHERYDAFALSVQVDPTLQAPVCSGAFVGRESNGRTLAVERNALVEVRLQAAPASTGYEWAVDAATPAAASVVLPCREPALEGCPQTYVFFFRAEQSSQVRVNHVRFGSQTEGVYVLNLEAVSSAQLCSSQVGTGCSIWTPASYSDANCQLSTIVAQNQIIEARVEDNGASTGFELVSTAAGLRLLANATIRPASHVCIGCPSTAAFFYEATATGSISIDARRPWAPSDSRNVFSLGVAVDPAHQAPVCSGGFFGIEASGSTLTVDPNALVEVRLHAAPGSTGFEWIVDPQTPAAAQVVLPCTRFGMGCPQTFVFFFRATQAGQIRVNNARFGVTQSVFSLNLHIWTSASDPNCQYSTIVAQNQIIEARHATQCSGGFMGTESNGNTLTVERNALVEVRLHAAPGSTGYEWIVDPQTPTAAEVVLPCLGTTMMLAAPRPEVETDRHTRSATAMSRSALISVVILAALARAQLCANQVGSGCSIWTPGTTADVGCQLNEVVAQHQIVEARVPENGGSTGFALTPRSNSGLRLLGNVTIRPAADCARMGCPSTGVFFYEATASGRISVVGRRSFAPYERYEAFSLGVVVDATLQAPVCSGGFVGDEYTTRTLTVERNAIVEVRLQASPASTGYEWLADPETPPVAQVVLPCREPAVDGCPQTYVFFFRATQEGWMRVIHSRFGRTQRIFAVNLQFSNSVVASA
eukprot:m51a1_g6071 hypothetical protein (825) ;mRNA; r:276942-284659